MKKISFLIFLALPFIVFAEKAPGDVFTTDDFGAHLRKAYERIELLRGERLSGMRRTILPVIPGAVNKDEDFKIINMNLTVIPLPGNSVKDSKITVNDQILMKVTGSAPLSQALFYVKSFEKISAESPDTEITYTTQPYFYDESITIVSIQFKNPVPKDTVLRVSITTEGTPLCDPSPFLGLVTCQYSKELTYDLSVMHPMRADGKEDAFSFDISIVVPDDYFSTASGEFAGRVENGDGTKTELWHADIAQFVSFGMAKFDIFSSEYGGENSAKYPVRSFVLPDKADKAKGFHPLVGKALSWYSKKFYPYQFPVISFNEISDSSDAAYATPMAQFMPASLINEGADDYQAIETFAHEVAHQWWAFMVMGSGYEYPWINEGFAEFSSMEFVTQDNAFARAFMHGVYAFLYFYMIDPKDDVPICSEDVFKNDYNYVLLTYYKGALVLAQLLNIMGEDMYRVLSYYAAKNLFQFTDIPKLKGSFKEVTGDDYSWYFDKWLYEAGYPIYTIKYDIRNEKGKNYADLFISQASSTFSSTGENVIFDMPLDIAFYDENKSEIKRITERINTQSFEKSYEFDEGVSSLTVDPGIKVYLKRLRSAQKGDVNLDMEVDGRDVLITAYSYGFNWYSYFEREDARFLPNADLDMNGVVDDSDLTSVVENFGKCLLSVCK
ncbi:MAG: M1 family aminopeptidase [Deltaproteobacteria bacterium]|nr:M1 family aminopeptidase [Deltaproteobacteria bacterium]